MENRIELWIFPTGNIAVYRGNAFIPTEQLTEEERHFVLNRVYDELRGEDLDVEIKKYTENLYNETFGNGQGTLDEFDWDDIATVIEDTAKHFYNPQPHWKPSEEQPDVDIREEIKKLEFMGSNDARDIQHIAEHFYELGKQSKEPVSHDLEEAADDMALKAFPEKKSYSTVYERVVDYNAVDRKNYRDGIIAGAKWQAKQLLKGSPLPEDTVIFQKGVEEGKRLMMEDAARRK